MKNAKIIIGANYGDEGKGLMTDYFASQDTLNTIVVRFNGGAQAGHTVVDNGKRKVFSHFGSGSLVGVPTFLGEDFICNPIVFLDEFKELVDNFDIYPNVIVHENCRITTPYDMIINQHKERQRGEAKHGSCGLGIWETVVRGADYGYPLYFKDLLNEEILRSKLETIANYWVPERLCKYNWDNEPEILYNPQLIDRFIEDCKAFVKGIVTCNSNYDALKGYDNVVFEGAQGLLLDWDSPTPDFATPSYTGLTSAMKIIDQLPVCETEVCYITRCYLTRHGRGPFPTENKSLKFIDRTNIPNEWQESLRFGYVDIDSLKAAIDNDFTKARSYFKKSLAITCLDQYHGVIFRQNGCLYKSGYSNKAFIETLKDEICPTNLYRSFGPTRTTITKEKMYE